MWRIPSIVTVKRPIPSTGVGGMDETHYPARNVSDTGWKRRNWVDTALDTTAGERTRTD
jgi:hypothetical protein